MIESSKSVLVVGDAPSTSSEIAYAFSDEVSVSFAEDAREAWQLMRKTIPSVVIMDMRAGSAGGYGLARDMAANNRLRDVPRFILLERRQDSWLAKQAGANLFRVRPIPADELAELALSLASGEGVSH